MLHFVYGLIVGIFVGGALSYLYAAKVIADYNRAVATAGLYLTKVGGKITAIRKGL